MSVSSPGMTPSDSLETQHASLKYPVLQYCLFHVLATSRCKSAASREEWRNYILVDQNRKYGYLSQLGFKHLLYLLV